MVVESDVVSPVVSTGLVVPIADSIAALDGGALTGSDVFRSDAEVSPFLPALTCPAVDSTTERASLLLCDRTDRRFCPAEFRAICNMIQRTCDLDACCNSDGSNALVREFCSLAKSFLEFDCSGKLVWLNCPYDKATEFLQHYFMCKASSPSETGAVLVLPKWTSAEWWPLVRHLTVLKEYPVGSHIFDYADPKGRRVAFRKGIPWPVVVLYDPPARPAVFGAVLRVRDIPDRPPAPNVLPTRVRLTALQSKPDVLECLLRGSLAGSPCNILFDTGADVSFMSPALALRCGLKSKPHSCEVDLGNGTIDQVKCLSKASLKLGAFSTKMDLLQLNLNDRFDVVLGRDFMNKHKCVLNFELQRVTCMKGRRRFTLWDKSTMAETHTSKRESVVMSALQTARYLRKMAPVVRRRGRVVVRSTPLSAFLCFVREKPEGTELVDSSQLEELLDSYADVFEEIPDGLPPERPSVGHIVPLKDGANPPPLRQYRLSHAERQELESQVETLLAKGWIQPSSSPFGAPVLFVPKKDGGFRMCIDYRALNKLTIKNKWPLPRIDDLLDTLSKAKVFSALDLAQGYHQIRIAESDVPKTAFCTPLGLYEYRVLSFGLSNAPATFQRVMSETLAEEIRAGFVVVYLDDILVFSKSVDEHLEQLERVLSKLRAAKFYAKRSKCLFNQSELKYLGFIVGGGNLKPDPTKVAAVLEWPVPKSKSELRSFLGLANYFRRFMHHYGSVCAPLNALLRDDVPNDFSGAWDARAQSAFEKVKELLTSAPVLALPRLDKPFTISCDACKDGVGAVLLQDDQPVAFESRKFTDIESRYPKMHPGDQELLAVVYALQKFRHYVLGQRFTLITDHQPNTKLQDQVSVQSWSGRKARWAEFLQQYDFDLQYRPGKENQVADALSRRPALTALLAVVTRRASRAAESEVVASESAPVEPSVGHVGLDSGLADREGASVTNPPGLAKAIALGYITDAKFSDVVAKYGLVKRGDFWYTKDRLLVVPDVGDSRRLILSEVHDCPYSGHCGRKSTYTRLRRAGLWWPTCARDVDNYVATCAMCQRNKAVRFQYGLLVPTAIPEGLWYVLTMDWITDLPRTARGYDRLLVVCEKLSTYCRLLPCRSDQTAEELAELFYQEIVRHEGWPHRIISDRDSLITSDFWQALNAVSGTSLDLSTAYHPQSDGQNERIHQVIEDMLRCYVDPTLKDWDTHLASVELALNTRYVERLECSPFFMVKGRDCQFPLDVALAKIRPARERAIDKDPSATAVHEVQQEQVRRARRLLEAANDRMKAREDKRRRLHPFAAGQRVLLSNKNLKLAGPKFRKLRGRFVGPFLITEMVGSAAARLQLPPMLRRVHPVFHVSLLKPFRTDGRQQATGEAVLLEGDEGEVRKDIDVIIDHRFYGSRELLQFRVRFVGCDESSDEWLSETDLAGAEDLIQHYWDSLSRRPSKRRRVR